MAGTVLCDSPCSTERCAKRTVVAASRGSHGKRVTQTRNRQVRSKTLHPDTAFRMHPVPSGAARLRVIGETASSIKNKTKQGRGYMIEFMKSAWDRSCLAQKSISATDCADITHTRPK